MDMKKKCGRCKEEKALEEFSKNKSKPDGLDEYCKICRQSYLKAYRAKRKPISKKSRDRQLKTYKEWYQENRVSLLQRIKDRRLLVKYGLTDAAYEKLLSKQGHACAICNRTIRLVVDHDHSTGKIRGLLCSRCNTGLGQFKDDPLLMEKGAQFLRGK